MTLRLEGKRFGRLRVLGRCGTIGQKSRWACVCDCGELTAARGDHMKRGATTSCGCYRRETAGDQGKTHGLSKTRPYRIWRDMINRCHYEKYPERHLYGGRGIAVCERWRVSFEAFIEDMGHPPADRSIDRIDVNGNYEPGNCRWATALEQAANKRPRADRGVVVYAAEASTTEGRSTTFEAVAV